jgi:two-component system, NtrC family, response regulator PilR
MTPTRPVPRLLVIDDEPDLCTLYELTLLREGYSVETAGNVDDALHALQDGTFDLVITDMRLPDGSGLDVLRYLETHQRDEKVMVITAFGSAESAVEALRAGAYDYLTKPVDLKQFRLAVTTALNSTSRPNAAPALAAATTPPPAAALSRLVGESVGIQQVRSLIEKVARSMAPVRLWGESGTGKELVARAIHDVSVRSAGPFVAVNCGAIPDHLLEAEFFGYRKGAFTGAAEDREGFFQAAQGGTLFLDEIGDLPIAMQAKLLRAIQERAVRPLGGVTEIHCDARIISASHKDLSQEVLAGRFRQDLFYRLNVILITLPPLRERLLDLPLIAEQLLQRIATESGIPHLPQLRESALQALQLYSFPGNVRELENMLHRAVALNAGHHIEAEDLGLSPTLRPQQSANAADLAESAWVDTQSGMADIGREVESTDSGHAHSTLPADLTDYLDRIERDILIRSLEQHRFNRTAAGASLGLSLRQMRYRMARLGVQVTSTGVVLGSPRMDPGTEDELA